MRKGFTLIELSIVLVIIGLIVGGVLVGRDLIRSSELQSVTVEFNRYVTAVNTFKGKYNALPGDMANATLIWGVAAGTGNDATCQNTPQVTSAATCNGDGNGIISDGTVTVSDHAFLFWKHLSNAGLIEGQYSGTNASNGGFSGLTVTMASIQPGWNSPLSKLPSAVWSVINFGGANASPQKFYGDYPVDARPYYINSLYLFPTTGADVWTGGMLRTAEAYSIDKKIDDGRPGSGKLEAFRGGNNVQTGPCLTHADPTIMQYDLSLKGANLCSLIFVKAF